MKKINDNTDFMTWCNNVNHSTIQCDLQDEFAHSSLNELKSLFMDMPKNDKHLAIFAIQKCMGSEMLITFVKHYARLTADKFYQEDVDVINDGWSELLTEKNDFNGERDRLNNTVKNLTRQNNELVKDSDTMSHTVANLYTTINNLESKIAALREQNKTLSQFEAHIKELLTVNGAINR